MIFLNFSMLKNMTIQTLPILIMLNGHQIFFAHSRVRWQAFVLLYILMRLILQYANIDFSSKFSTSRLLRNYKLLYKNLYFHNYRDIKMYKIMSFQRRSVRSHEMVINFFLPIQEYDGTLLFLCAC